MKRPASFTGLMAACYRQMVCPFCKALTVENPTMPWCATCTVEYVITRGRIVFDDQRKTPRFAMAKAINRMGGIRIGGKP